MLTKLFEWYRVVNPNPSDEVIEKRKASALALIEGLTAATDHTLLFPCIAGVVNGFDPRLDQDSAIVKMAIDAIRQHQPAFPQDLSENALEIRISCATAIGELLSRKLQNDTQPNDLSPLIAALITSALPLRPTTKGRHLNAVLTQLTVLATAVSERGSLQRRKREGFSILEFDEIKTTALPAFWESLLPKLKVCLQDIQLQATADREELDVLWWMYTGFSTTTETALIDLKPGAISFCSGAEIANLVLLPPTRSSQDMIRRVIRDHRKKTDPKEISLKLLASDCESKLWRLLASDDNTAKKLVQSYPPLFPISWVCNRLLESQGIATWGEEFTAKTGIPETHQLSLEEFGVQVFSERIAQRTCAQTLGG